jgi:hypothetical protein
MKLLTIETESRLGTLWDEEQCTQFCSKDKLWVASTRRAVSRKILATKTGRNWIGHDQ